MYVNFESFIKLKLKHSAERGPFQRACDFLSFIVHISHIVIFLDGWRLWARLVMIDDPSEIKLNSSPKLVDLPFKSIESWSISHFFMKDIKIWQPANFL